MIIKKNGKTYRVVEVLETKKFLEDISAQFRAARALSKITLKEASSLSGVSISSLSQIENGKMSPSVCSMLKMAKVYKYVFKIG